MRWIVFFLFVFNGLIFIWFSFQQEAEAPFVGAREQIENVGNAATITLLSEVNEASLKVRDIRMKPNAQPQMVLDESDKCALVGPFLEMISARQTKGRLDGMGLVSHAVMLIKQLPVINWVYVPPLPSKKEALAMLRDMQEKDIDSFLIADGEFENGISLGFYSNVESAKSILQERLAQGYPVKLVEKQREQKTYWLTFDQKLAPKISDEMLAGLEESNFVIKKQEKSCNDVAQMEIIE